MSFISISFIVFLPIVFSLYWLLKRLHNWQNFCLLVASYVFYGLWDWRFLSLIFISSISSFLSGLFLERIWFRRLVVTLNICLNIGILAFFKYYNFFLDNLTVLLSQFGFTLDIPTLHIILPVGISFYTFQSISYTIDVYRGKLPATRDVLAFFTYIAFFPQLVAGPIEKATNLLPQMLSKRSFDYRIAVDGLRRILWGFFKKMVVADNCAIAVDLMWNDYSEAGFITLFCTMILFTFQIYGDFSGYSDIAIGVAKLFGIRLTENFRLPYFSRCIGEFWRRWHVSLMIWFRDYVYIPIGGSRNGLTKNVRNILVVFMLSGLWHGAKWTFVVWGFYHASLLISERLRGKSYRKDDNQITTVGEIPSILLTFLLVSIGWIIFRSSDMTEAITFFSKMYDRLICFDMGSLQHGKQALLYCLLLVGIEWIQRDRLCPLDLNGCLFGRYRIVRWTFYYIVFLLMFFLRGEEQTFIYFQF